MSTEDFNKKINEATKAVAALRKDIKKIKKSSKLSKEDRLQMDSKAALVAHSVIDPSIQMLLSEMWSGEHVVTQPLILILTFDCCLENPHLSGNTTNADDVLTLAMNKSSGYVNFFLNVDLDEDLQRHHPDVYHINPSHALFVNGDQFCKYVKVMKLRFDDLLENMSRMLGQSSEEITQEQVLFQLCYRDGIYDYGLIYCYFLWKGYSSNIHIWLTYNYSSHLSLLNRHRS